MIITNEVKQKIVGQAWYKNAERRHDDQGHDELFKQVFDETVCIAVNAVANTFPASSRSSVVSATVKVVKFCFDRNESVERSILAVL